jgi:tetratricopeptide (TPR) repeat protein
MVCWREPRAIPLARRLLVAACAILAAGVLFRSQLASGLVSRGDDLLGTGSSQRALVYYGRALWFDSASDVAAERFAFTALMLRRPAALESAVAVASRALAREPGNDALLTDRALCLNALGDFGASRRDFETLAARTADPRYYEFAAQQARRSGDRARAARLFHRVIALAPSFAAARRELERLGETRR